MYTFHKFKTKIEPEIRPLTPIDIKQYKETGNLYINPLTKEGEVFIPIEDIGIDNIKLGDVIIRKPNDTNKAFLLSEQQFKDNYIRVNNNLSKTITIEEFNNNKELYLTMNDNFITIYVKKGPAVFNVDKLLDK